MLHFIWSLLKLNDKLSNYASITILLPLTIKADFKILSHEDSSKGSRQIKKKTDGLVCISTLRTVFLDSQQAWSG